MRCPECAADVPPLREFCPTCGAPTNPTLLAHRSDARGGRSDEELRGNRKRVLIGGAAILLALAVAGKFALPGPTIRIVSDDAPKGPVVTNAEDLARAYSEDSARAAKRFGGREIMVSGEFLRIVPDGYGSIDVRLKTSNPDFPLGVDVAGASVDDAKLLRPGQQVAVSCRRVAGSGNDPWLEDCAIQPTADTSAPPAPAPAPPSAPAPPDPPRDE